MSTSRCSASFRPTWLISASLAAAPAVARTDPPASLDAVTVTGVRADGLRPTTVEAGSFRGSDIMDVPSTVNVVTREALDLQAAGGLYDAVRNTAGVTRQQNGGDTWDQLVIRGIAVENRTNDRLNGSLPIQNFSQVPMEDKERVEVLKGASAVCDGSTSPAGVVNVVTERAGTTPVTTLGIGFDDNGTALATADVGRRFGSEGQYGLRVNAAGGTLGSFLDGVGNGNQRFGSAAFDWRVDPRLVIKADLEYDKRQVTEEAGVALPVAANGVITLPHPVDPRRNVGGSQAGFDTRSNDAQLRADHALSDGWALTLEGGKSVTARDRRLAILTLVNPTGVGTGNGAIGGDNQHQVTASEVWRTELFGAFSTGFLKHELTLGLTTTKKTQDKVYTRNYTIASQNLDAPLPITAITLGAYPVAPGTAGLQSRDSGACALGRLVFGDHWQAVVGLRHEHDHSAQGTLAFAADETPPMGSLVSTFTPASSVYGSYSRGLEEGETAPTGSVNQNTHLPPGISNQKEIGARWLTPGGTLLSAAVFDITRPGSITTPQNSFVRAGESNDRGLELSTQGQLTRRLGWQTSAQLLDPTFRNISAAYDVRAPENAAGQTASAFVAYDIAQLPGQTLDGGSDYTGRRPVNDLDQAFLGGVTLWSLGARDVAPVMGRRGTVQLNVDNVGDRRYWAGAGTRLVSGAPRTCELTLKVDL